MREQIKGIEELAELNNNIKFLDSDTKEYLSKLGVGENTESIYAYIIMGKDYTVIPQLWNFIKEKALNDFSDKKQLEILNTVLYMCIKIYNLYHDEKIVYTDVALGSEYDSSKCIKTSGSSFNGKVSEILVRGFYNSRLDAQFNTIVKVQ